MTVASQKHFRKTNLKKNFLKWNPIKVAHYIVVTYLIRKEVICHGMLAATWLLFSKSVEISFQQMR